MKINRIIINVLLVTLLLNNIHLLQAMLRERPQSAPPSQPSVSQKIITRNKVLTLSALAALLAIPVAYVTRLVHQYAKEYGLPAVIVAVRYNLPFQPPYLKIVAAAAQHDNSRLKDGLLALNNLLLGQDWRQSRPSLVDDFITMDQIAFSQKHGAEIRKHILHLVKTYAAAGDLYFRKSNARTYTRGAPSIKNQVKYMHELDQTVGLA